MALDVGDRRIGIALSDEEGRVAFPRETLRRTELDKDIDTICDMAEREKVEEILVGMPLTLHGSQGPQAQKVVEFIRALRKRTSAAVNVWDERLTTVSAERVLIEGEVRRARRREVIDKMAAAILLQSYLDYRSQKQASGPSEV